MHSAPALQTGIYVVVGSRRTSWQLLTGEDGHENLCNGHEEDPEKEAAENTEQDHWEREVELLYLKRVVHVEKQQEVKNEDDDQGKSNYIVVKRVAHAHATALKQGIDTNDITDAAYGTVQVIVEGEVDLCVIQETV